MDAWKTTQKAGAIPEPMNLNNVNVNHSYPVTLMILRPSSCLSTIGSVLFMLSILGNVG